jgi:integration host factor subunit beta
MTKAELVEDVARAAELTKKDAERLVEIVFESIIDTLNQGEKIELRGFGSFRVRERGARRGRNPKTGDPVDIPAKRVPYFKPGKELKELINEDAPQSVRSDDGDPQTLDFTTAPTGSTSPASVDPGGGAVQGEGGRLSGGDGGGSSGGGSGEGGGQTPPLM